MAKLTVSIPDDLKASMQKSNVPINLSKVVTGALDEHLQNVEDGCFWGQEYGLIAPDEDLEDICELALTTDRLKSNIDKADVVFAKRVWLGKKPTIQATRHAEGFIKWLDKHKLRSKSGDAAWMAAFSQGVRLVYLAREKVEN